MKSFRIPRPLPLSLRKRLEEQGSEGRRIAGLLQSGLPAMALTSGLSLPTAFANDVAPDLVYAQQVAVWGKPGDVLIGLSTSGCSSNVLAALRTARAIGMQSVGLTGASGGSMNTEGLCDVLIQVPETETYRVQELHLPIYHAICDMLERRLFVSSHRRDEE
jgi:DNA-binding MurR/RpiR family transcriptional regulator